MAAALARARSSGHPHLLQAMMPGRTGISIQVPAAVRQQAALGLPEGRRARRDDLGFSATSGSRWFEAAGWVRMRLDDGRRLWRRDRDRDGVDAHEAGDDVRRWLDGDLSGCRLLCSAPAPPSGWLSMMMTHLHCSCSCSVGKTPDYLSVKRSGTRLKNGIY